VGEGSPFRTIGLTAAQREAIGRAELARAEALSRHHRVPLHTWLGGALRPRVSFAVTMPLGAMSAVPAGIRRVALVSSENDPARLIAVLGAAADTLGPDVDLALHLDAQLAPEALGMLREVGRRLKLAYIADPCADLVTACRTFGSGAPPLAVSAHRHTPRQLAGAMRDGGVQVLLVDPVLVGGPEAVRAWSTAADLTGIELALVAHDDSEPAVSQLAQLASTLRAATQPLVVAPAARTGGHIAIDGATGIPAITRITLHSVSVPMRQLYVSALYMRRTTERIVVELETDDGARGFGETNGTEEVAQSITRMANRLIGQNPLDRLRLRQAMAGPMVGSRNGLADWQALAGLDMALFDWAGRHFDMPIWRLLGGSGGRDFEAVAHIPALLLDEPVDRRELPRLFADPGRLRDIVDYAVHLHHDPGFTAFKMKCTGTSPDWDVAVLHALRAALGDDVKLRWDPNASYPPAQATVLCQRLEELNLEYYEDPIHGIPGMTQLRARMKTPLATNMCVVNFDHLASVLHRPCVDVVLADLVMWGGIQSMADLGGVTPLFDFDLTIHSAFELGIGMAANLQVAAALDPVRRAIDFGLENMVQELIVPHIPVRAGRVAAPEGAGLGVEPDWGEIERFSIDVTVIASSEATQQSPS
jgi:glucarate dehydratase